MRFYLFGFLVLRILGWCMGIGSVIAYFMKYEGAWGYAFNRENMYFYLVSCAFTDLLYQHIKLLLSLKREDK